MHINKLLKYQQTLVSQEALKVVILIKNQRNLANKCKQKSALAVLIRI